MNSPINKQIIDSLREAGVDFFVSVPCKFFTGLLKELDNTRDIVHVPVTREEEGIGVCSGAFLGGKMPCIIMQNSGLGNSINALASLVALYKIPIVLMISYRGTPGEKVSAQFEMAKLTKNLLGLLKIPLLQMRSKQQVERELASFAAYSKVIEYPVAVLMDFMFWGNTK